MSPTEQREAELARMRENFRVALQLHELGVAIMRQNLRRQYPDESEEKVGLRLRAWMRREDERDRLDPTGVIRPRPFKPS